MNVDGKPYRSIWVNSDGWSVDIIDQTRLPHEFSVLNLQNLAQACAAIRDMAVRGAPLIGSTAAYGYYLALNTDGSDKNLATAYDELLQTRPTAVNLRWALDRIRGKVAALPAAQRAENAFAEAAAIAELDVETNRQIGLHGLKLIEQIAAQKADDEAVNILTHCNAGWLATVDWGTATAPIYMAHEAGIPLHVWVDETRPRNQGASLTAWELQHHAVPHTLIVDNAGGHLMQTGAVDLCLVGSDRTTRSGDVCNKIGTYLKALAAADNGIPFYVCLPSSTIDWTISDGLQQVPIEQRNGIEVSQVSGRLKNGEITSVSIVTEGTPVANPAFDVTPAKLVSGLITEAGIIDATESEIGRAFARDSSN
ncbi:MAG: S-methyl-5-thioribose-1-phosphate isomerase [Gammaproteobacteria bacterium]|nr:MAG: S-methyl-5-thioribose-1-phosphate isomerase [Gammaproteobacteria bacterium]UCH40071.1 MAG: S-methyl-5-thioribose-1-phosphate isomerase [Gammaproteobacteria bacterium]